MPDNSSEDVLEALRGVSQVMEAHHTETLVRFDEVGRRFNTVDESFAKVDIRLGVIESRLAGIETRMAVAESSQSALIKLLRTHRHAPGGEVVFPPSDEKD